MHAWICAASGYIAIAEGKKWGGMELALVLLSPRIAAREQLTP